MQVSAFCLLGLLVKIGLRAMAQRDTLYKERKKNKKMVD